MGAGRGPGCFLNEQFLTESAAMSYGRIGMTRSLTMIVIGWPMYGARMISPHEGDVTSVRTNSPIREATRYPPRRWQPFSNCWKVFGTTMTWMMTPFIYRLP